MLKLELSSISKFSEKKKKKKKKKRKVYFCFVLLCKTFSFL